MKNKYILIMMILLSSYAYSQIGIKTATPKAMLHVDGSLQMTKELRVGGTATTEGNAGISGELLTSQGVGLPPKWSIAGNIDIPQVTTMGNRTMSTIYAANSVSTVQYSTFPKNDPAYLTYNTITGEFTVIKAGYYLLTGYLEYVITVNPSDGTAVTNIYNNGSNVITASSSGHPISANIIEHSLSGLSFLNVGDVINVTGFFTRSYAMRNSSISFMYLGN